MRYNATACWSTAFAVVIRFDTLGVICMTARRYWRVTGDAALSSRAYAVPWHNRPRHQLTRCCGDPIAALVNTVGMKIATVRQRQRTLLVTVCQRWPICPLCRHRHLRHQQSRRLDDSSDNHKSSSSSSNRRVDTPRVIGNVQSFMINMNNMSTLTYDTKLN